MEKNPQKGNIPFNLVYTKTTLFLGVAGKEGEEQLEQQQQQQRQQAPPLHVPRLQEAIPAPHCPQRPLSERAHLGAGTQRRRADLSPVRLSLSQPGGRPSPPGRRSQHPPGQSHQVPGRGVPTAPRRCPHRYGPSGGEIFRAGGLASLRWSWQRRLVLLILFILGGQQRVRVVRAVML
jgi:hypothetical protein